MTGCTITLVGPTAGFIKFEAKKFGHGQSLGAKYSNLVSGKEIKTVQ